MWMTQFGLGALPGGLSLLYSIFFMPESDGWLTDRLINDNDVKNDYGMTFTEEGNNTSEHNAGNVTGEKGYKLLCSNKGLKWVIICIGLPLCQQLTGINAVMFYGPQIFEGQHMSNPLLINMLVVGLWNTLAVGSKYCVVKWSTKFICLSLFESLKNSCQITNTCHFITFPFSSQYLLD